MNSRIEKLAVEEREKKMDRDSLTRRDRTQNDEGPPPVANSRFAAAAEADRSSSCTRPEDRGPPPVANSRFAAAAEADRSTSYNGSEDRGPPPVANSRFAAAAEADRSSNQYRENSGDQGPPPVVNSRFSAAAEADGRSAFSRDDRGPPPIANSRFAAAAARADEEKMEFEERRRDRDSFYGRDEPQRGAMPQNSRFLAAAAADSDYVDRDERDRRMAQDSDMDRGQSGTGNRFAHRSDNNASRGGRSTYDSGRSGRDYEEPPPPPQLSRVDELLKPKKQDDIVVVPPTKEHEANILNMGSKAFTRQEETFLSQSSKKTEEAHQKVEDNLPVDVVTSAESLESLLTEFSKGEKLGVELKAWCTEKKPMPPVEDMVLHMLKENERLNPDPDCGWADPSKYGAALLSLVEDDLYHQMQILWAIQMYCESLGFPKLNGESVAQSMFRAMYKYDLAEADAFIAWKEDESDTHEKGKMTAIVQTIEWFNWLEADDDDEGEDQDDEDVEY
jgi:eIF4-gamma/eIF5/eIF2-epsilon